MSEKKTIIVRTNPQDVEIEGNIITNDELKTLLTNIHGGNGDKSTADLLRHIAANVLNKDNRGHAELIRSCSYRAVCLEDAFENVKAMIWPKDQVDNVVNVVVTVENEAQA